MLPVFSFQASQLGWQTWMKIIEILKIRNLTAAIFINALHEDLFLQDAEMANICESWDRAFREFCHLNGFWPQKLVKSCLTPFYKEKHLSPILAKTLNWKKKEPKTKQKIKAQRKYNGPYWLEKNSMVQWMNNKQHVVCELLTYVSCTLPKPHYLNSSHLILRSSLMEAGEPQTKIKKSIV